MQKPARTLTAAVSTSFTPLERAGGGVHHRVVHLIEHQFAMHSRLAPPWQKPRVK